MQSTPAMHATQREQRTQASVAAQAVIAKLPAVATLATTSRSSVILGSMRDTLELDTPHGLARAHLHPVEAPRAALVLGHGAGGGVAAPDLVAATAAAQEAQVSVALVEQPYRVAGRRSSPRAPQLDAAWIAVVEQLPFDGVPLVTGGRSAGARVACRTAGETRSAGVLCLAFPLLPPGAAPEKTRQGEVDAVTVPTLVVQGRNDRFGMPRPGPRREVVTVNGDHALRSDRAAVLEAVRDWLGRIV
ncbi:MAG TPA: alpha/beta family hydrolase [Solirubrobacteraceae bacterium]|nr:alpha/beta family hydrolase [Solirubrobacteraceae bacterium]